MNQEQFDDMTLGHFFTMAYANDVALAPLDFVAFAHHACELEGDDYLSELIEEFAEVAECEDWPELLSRVQETGYGHATLGTLRQIAEAIASAQRTS